jgi:hypothetical protein
MVDIGAPVVADPLEGLINQGNGVRIFLLPVVGYLIKPDNAPVGGNVMGRNTIQDKTSRVYAALIAETKITGVTLFLDGSANVFYRRKDNLLGRIVYLHSKPPCLC